MHCYFCEAVSRQLYRMEDVTAFMLDMAEKYVTNPEMQKRLDAVYGEGSTLFIGQALQAFYNSARCKCDFEPPGRAASRKVIRTAVSLAAVFLLQPASLRIKLPLSPEARLPPYRGTR